MDGTIGHPAVFGLDLLHGISAGIQSFQHDQTLGVGKMLLVIAAVDLGNAEQDAGQGFAGLGVDFQQPEAGAGAVHEVHNHILVLLRVDPDGLAIVGIEDIGGGDIGFIR